MNKKWYLMRMAALAAVCTLLSACAGVRAYSETRDKEGLAAKKAWSDVDTASQITVARANLASLLGQQLLTADKIVAAKRATTILSMATGGTISKKLADPVKTQLIQLAGSTASAEEWNAAEKLEATQRSKQLLYERELTYVGVEIPTCEDLKKQDIRDAFDELAKSPSLAGQTVHQYLGKLVAVCTDPGRSATAAVPLASPAEIFTTRQQLADELAAIDAERRQTKAARILYKAAADEYKSAAAQQSQTPDTKARTDAALGKLRKAFDLIKKAPDSFSQKFVSEQRRDAIDRFFAAVLDTKPGEAAPPDAGRSALLFTVLPEWLDQTKQALTDARQPTLLPLVMRKQYEQIQVDALTRDVAVREQTLSLLEQKLAIQSQQVDHLLTARSGLEFVKELDPGTLDKSYSAVLLAQQGTAKAATSAKTLRVREILLEASGNYFDATSRLEGEVVKISLQQNYLERARALGYSEANIAQWTTLIGGSVDQLAMYGASGIKRESVLALMNSLTLLWIGKGVN